MLIRARAATTWAELGAEVTALALRVFDADLVCTSLDDSECRFELTPAGPVNKSFARRYDDTWRGRDPIANTARQSHEACHDGAVFDARRWRQQPLFDVFCAASGLHHYMVAPLLGRGTVIGTVSVSRHARRRGFSDADRLTASALASHASALVAPMPSLARAGAAPVPLTRIERLTATLAADGLTVDEIADNRGVSPNTVKETLRVVYRKLGVDSRVELYKALTLRSA
jgi:DNA-binding CsgD family transcriptional regulator